MTDNVENLILEHLRAIRNDIGGIKDDVREIKQRLTSLEPLRVFDAITPTSRRYSRPARMIRPFERIEHRLDLAEG